MLRRDCAEGDLHVTKPPLTGPRLGMRGHELTRGPDADGRWRCVRCGLAVWIFPPPWTESAADKRTCDEIILREVQDS